MGKDSKNIWHGMCLNEALYLFGISPSPNEYDMKIPTLHMK